MPRIVVAVIKSGAGLGGTHPIPKIVVVAPWGHGWLLRNRIAEVQAMRAEQATASARQRGDPESFTPADFPVLWQGDPDDEALDSQFREWLDWRLNHPHMHRGERTGWY